MNEMFCSQCQETARGAGCTSQGVCGKKSRTSNLQDTLIYALKGLSLVNKRLREKRKASRSRKNDEISWNAIKSRNRF